MNSSRKRPPGSIAEPPPKSKSQRGRRSKSKERDPPVVASGSASREPTQVTEPLNKETQKRGSFFRRSSSIKDLTSAPNESRGQKKPTPKLKAILPPVVPDSAPKSHPEISSPIQPSHSAVPDSTSQPRLEISNPIQPSHSTVPDSNSQPRLEISNPIQPSQSAVSDSTSQPLLQISIPASESQATPVLRNDKPPKKPSERPTRKPSAIFASKSRAQQKPISKVTVRDSAPLLKRVPTVKDSPAVSKSHSVVRASAAVSKPLPPTPTSVSKPLPPTPTTEPKPITVVVLDSTPESKAPPVVPNDKLSRKPSKGIIPKISLRSTPKINDEKAQKKLREKEKEAQRKSRHAAPGTSGGGAAVKGGGGGKGLNSAGSVTSLDSKQFKVPAAAAVVPPPPPSMEAVQAQLEKENAALVADKAQLEKEKAALVADKALLEKEKAAFKARVEEFEAFKEETIKQQEQRSMMEMEALLPPTDRVHLHGVTHSPLSDSEKEQLLLVSHHTSPATEQASAGELAEWDKHSNHSISEVSVACLQDDYHQLQETHYSTSEELQATVQELTDLQTQHSDLLAEKERLEDHNRILRESLHKVTERLKDSDTEVENLQKLLVRDGNEGEITPEHEQTLVDLLKNAQEKYDSLVLKQEKLITENTELHQVLDTNEEQRVRLEERVKLLESAIDAAHAERKQLEEDLDCAKEEISSRSIENSRLSKLLEIRSARIEELEQARELDDKSDLAEMLDTACREKDTLESQNATLQEQLSRSQSECTRLREQLQQLQEECKVIRNNSKSALSDAEYQRDSLRQDKEQLTADLQMVQKSFADLEVQCQYHLEDKRRLKAALSEIQRRIVELESGFLEKENALEEERRQRELQNEEWEKFQSDLLMTVRVANNFKTEAQEEQQKLVLENKALRDKVRLLEGQLEKPKAQKPPSPSLRPASTQFPSTTESSVEMAMRCHKAGVSRQDSHLSVKSLIESIENATKQAKSGPRSRSSSTSSLGSVVGDVPPTPTFPRRTDSMNDGMLPPMKTPLRDQQQNNNQTDSGKNSVNNRKALLTDNSFNKPGSGIKTPEEPTTISILANKTMDFVRRNSYGDLSERKDPLAMLVRNGGSKRNALLKWCQQKTVGYRNIDITNFSSSWNDGLALCAILHSYLPDRVPYDTLTPNEKRRNFTIAFAAAESVGISTTLNLNDMIQLERPDWNQVMAYVTAIYKHFET